MKKLPSTSMLDDVVLGGPKKGRLGRITDRALNTLAVIDQGVLADRALAQTIKSARDLGSTERHQLADVIYGVIRHRRRIQFRLTKGLKACGKNIERFDAPMRLRLEILCALLDQGQDLKTLDAWDSYAFKRVPKLFQRIQKSKAPIKDFAVQWSLPSWMAQRMSTSLGDATAEAWAKALLERAPLTLRVNCEKISREDLIEKIQAAHGIACIPTDRSPKGIILLGRADVQNWPEYRRGEIEIQDEGSQLIVEALGPRPGENILDACAGAGGKTLAIASAMRGSGQLVGIDVDQKKLAELKKRAARAGHEGIKTVNCDLIDLPARYHNWADRVLVDAPCSGTGRLRRQPDAKWRLEESAFLRFPSLQFSLLNRSIDAAKPNGIVIYATCSIMSEENEMIVERLLSEENKVAPLALSQISPIFGDEAWTYIEPGPDAKGPDGYFIAAFRKIESPG